MKKWNVLFTAAVMATLMAAPAYAGSWGQDETGYWYQNDSGSYARDQIMNIDGVNYGFNGEAYMVTGWYQSNGQWYYFDLNSGAQLTGWQKIDNAWYYMNQADGKMQTSWLNHGGQRYYLDPATGAMKTGAFTVDGYFYFAEADGSLRRNKLEKENGISIRYDDEGRQWYKNSETTVNGMNDGESWLPVLAADELAQQREEVQQSNADYIIEVKDELYEEYKDNVITASSYKTRNSRTEKWIAKVNRQLADLYVSQEEIDQYIKDVKYGIYGNDDYYTEDDYDYEY
ncbi:MAG: hypothetical protein Q4F28_13775 [Eubacteriales bacterium]|nr:hypothetical protein [Eubacteriales bacterium]